MPIATRETKGARTPAQERAIFKLFSLGVVTNRDDWVYAEHSAEVESRVRTFIETYNREVRRLSAHRESERLAELLDSSIKWTRAIKNDLRKGVTYEFDSALLVRSIYRPFVRRWLYFSRQLNEMRYLQQQIFPIGSSNLAIAISGAPVNKPFQCLAIDELPNLHLLEDTQTLPLSRWVDGHKTDNVTDWALDQFRKRYQPGQKDHPITKETVFAYVYGVLHDPVYREKYALNLRREFPRIPFYADFWRWADWGKTLTDLHIGYETAAPFELERVERPDEKARDAGQTPKVLLKPDKAAGRIMLDSETTLRGIPKEAWAYKLGNRSALEWILDQYKEKKPKDPTIREKFNTYRFAQCKEKVVDLLSRVAAVSVKTVEIVGAMEKATR